MIKPIRVEDRHSALEFLALQMISYLREAELSGLSDIPLLWTRFLLFSTQMKHFSVI